MKSYHPVIPLEGSTQIRVHYDCKKFHWVIRISDQAEMVQELYSESEPSIMVYMVDKFSEKPVMRTYPSDEIMRYKNKFR